MIKEMKLSKNFESLIHRNQIELEISMKCMKRNFIFDCVNLVCQKRKQ